MPKENAVLNEKEELNVDSMESLDFDELEEKLQSQLEEELADMQFWTEEKEKIGSPDHLGDVIMDVVWEQFLNQVAVTAGEDFIKENRGLTLDLRDEAHIQTTENFENGQIAAHNSLIDYQKRYDDWQNNFQKDPNIVHKASNFRYNEDKKVWEQYDNRSKSWKKVLNKGTRSDFDKGRPTGKNTANTNMDHTISAAEIIRDPEANAHMTREEQVAFANNEKNLNLMDSAANQSKGDSSMEEFLNSEKDGKKPEERFNINPEELRKKDKEARNEYEKRKKEAIEKSIAAGKQSQREEAFRIGGKALRAVLMQLLAEFLKEIIAKLVRWFKSAQKTLDTLLSSLKEAIHSFVEKMKTHLLNMGDTIFTTVATAIVGPVFGTIKKAWMLLKQSWNSLKSAVDYRKDPANKGKPVGIRLMEVGKIVIAGLAGAGALLLGDVFEKGLMAVPIFAFEIPLLGSLANIVGIFLGAVVAGIIGAIAINFLDKLIAKKQKQEVQATIISKGNEILRTQAKQQIISEAVLENNKTSARSNISNRHYEAVQTMRDSFTNIMEDFVSIPSTEDIEAGAIDEKDMETIKSIDNVSDDLDKLLNSI